MEETMKNSVF